MTEHRRGEPGDNSTSKGDRQLVGLTQRFLLGRGHPLERQLVTEFINGELHERGGNDQHTTDMVSVARIRYAER